MLSIGIRLSVHDFALAFQRCFHIPLFCFCFAIANFNMIIACAISVDAMLVQIWDTLVSNKRK